ncbi:hypothetical protein C0993_009033 [Termitomyces sp. T159_Od127]|nr:hypothetical protein C0993_009033 [Termitomyces sp. T159_Od127]
MHFRHWDNEKYANLANMLYQNYRQALKIIETNTLDIQHVLELRNIDEAALGTDIADERNFFSTLGKESDGDLHAIAYVELLQELWSVEAKLNDVSTRFRMQTPTDYHFIAPEQSYAINLSQTRKTDTARRQLNDRHGTLLIEILDLEQRMNITSRWTQSHTEYKMTAEYIANRKYEKALDHLQTLVIKRLFELHKLNLSQTGYRMRTHIAKSLQTRSKTIRAAITRYNNLAIPLGKPTLDWTKVSHYAFLDDFYILRHSRNGINQKPWADPVIRETMRKFQRLQRAKEEINRCNIEIRRLHTSIVDEHHEFDEIMKKMGESPDPLNIEVHEFIDRRRAVNRMLLARIWDTYALQGFTGNPTPGVSKSSSRPLEVTPEPITCGDDNDSDSDSNDDLGDALLEDLGGLVDFISNID